MLHDMVAVRKHPPDESSRGGIIIPEIARQGKDPAVEGTVIAVGPGWWTTGASYSERVPPAVAVGDRVLFGKYVGTETEYDGVKVTVLSEQEILAVIDS